MIEIWKDIVGYEGKYQISNLGRVKSLNYHREQKEKILIYQRTGSGYARVELCKNGIRQKYLVHRLVAQAFLDNPDNLPCVNHKDYNRRNNQISNLEWCDYSYNNKYSQAKKVGCYKDGKLIKVYDALRDVEKDGFNFGDVGNCCRKRYRYKSHKGFTWKYIS